MVAGSPITLLVFVFFPTQVFGKGQGAVLAYVQGPHAPPQDVHPRRGIKFGFFFDGIGELDRTTGSRGSSLKVATIQIRVGVGVWEGIGWCCFALLRTFHLRSISR